MHFHRYFSCMYVSIWNSEKLELTSTHFPNLFLFVVFVLLYSDSYKISKNQGDKQGMRNKVRTLEAFLWAVLSGLKFYSWVFSITTEIQCIVSLFYSYSWLAFALTKYWLVIISWCNFRRWKLRTTCSFRVQIFPVKKIAKAKIWDKFYFICAWTPHKYIYK